MTNPSPTKNGIELNAKNVSILDSSIRNINVQGIECHAIAAFNTTGTFAIVNNRLEAGSLNVLFGGDVPNVPNAVTTDVEFRRNRANKPLSKKSQPSGFRLTAKNNFEIKSGKYFVIEGNLFDGSWIGSNQYYLVNIRVASGDTGSWARCEDIQFTNNKVKQGPGGFLLGAREEATNIPSRILIANNLVEDIGGTAYNIPTDPSSTSDGVAFQITDVPIDLKFRHNTIFCQKAIINATGDDHRAIVYNDNIAPHGAGIFNGGIGYGIKGDGVNQGTQTFDTYFPGSTPAKNVIAGGDANYPSPSNNYYYRSDASPLSPFANIDNHLVDRAAGNYHLVAGSPGKAGATDGSDVGANIDVLTKFTAGAISGVWNNPKPSDFDGDGKTDIAVFRPSNGTWYISQSSTGTLQTQAWGSSGDVIVPADYDGDGKIDTAVFRASTAVWYILNSSDSTTRAESFGLSTDVPVPADYDGDGRADIAVWCSSNSTWYIAQSYNGVLATTQFGNSTDKPVPADYDDDGRADIAVYRASSSSTWYIQKSDGTIRSESFGVTGDLLVTGVYDVDGKSDPAVFRPSTTTWYILPSTTGVLISQAFGLSTDTLVPGDFDGDGRTDTSVFRPSTNTWYILQSSNLSTTSQTFGSSGDVPVPSAYIR